MYLLSLPIYKDLANESISELKTMLFLPLTGPAVFSNKEYLLPGTYNKTGITKNTWRKTTMILPPK